MRYILESILHATYIIDYVLYLCIYYFLDCITDCKLYATLYMVYIASYMLYYINLRYIGMTYRIQNATAQQLAHIFAESSGSQVPWESWGTLSISKKCF